MRKPHQGCATYFHIKQAKSERQPPDVKKELQLLKTVNMELLSYSQRPTVKARAADVPL